MRHFVVGILLLRSVAAQPAPAEFADVRAAVVAGIANAKAPSLALAVVRADRIVWAEGFGHADVASARPTTPDTLYRLASISKPMTATAILMLAERGKLELDAPANGFLAKGHFVAHVGTAEQITLRRLLTHSAGLPTHYTFFYGGAAPPSVEETVARHGFTAWEPGTRFEYSNLGYGVLGHVVGTVSGIGWERFLEQELFRPLGMEHSTARFSSEDAQRSATPYRRGLGGRWLEVGHYVSDHPGASAVCSSARDVARFLMLHLRRGEVAGARVLKAETVELSQRTAIAREAATEGESRERGYGLGWFTETRADVPSISHSGGMPGVSNLARAFPTLGSGFVVLTNTDDRSLTNEVAELLTKALLPKPPESQPSSRRGPRRGVATGGISISHGEAEFVGDWKGHLHVQGNAFPLRLVCVDHHEPSRCRLEYGERLQHQVVLDAEDHGARDAWKFRMDAPLVTHAGWHGVPKLEFDLRREGDRLFGVCLAKAEGYFALASWVEMRR